MYRNDDFTRTIGHISVFFATLDFLVSEVMIRLTCRSGTKIPFPEKATLGQKFALLEKLGADRVTNPELLAELQTHSERARQVAEERNRYIHDQWVFNPALIPDGKIQRLKLVFGSAPQTVIAELKISELEALLAEIGNLQQVYARAINVLDPSTVTCAKADDEEDRFFAGRSL